MSTLFIIVFDIVIVSVFTLILVSTRQTDREKRQAPPRPKGQINGRRASDYSFKFNTPNGNSHQDQVSYQHEYSLKETLDPQKYQEIRERRELARIVDPPLSEAERNVLGYRIKENR